MYYVVYSNYLPFEYTNISSYCLHVNDLILCRICFQYDSYNKININSNLIFIQILHNYGTYFEYITFNFPYRNGFYNNIRRNQSKLNELNMVCNLMLPVILNMINVI